MSSADIPVQAHQRLPPFPDGQNTPCHDLALQGIASPGLEEQRSKMQLNSMPPPLQMVLLSRGWLARAPADQATMPALHWNTVQRLTI
jgi:hypothetical protein